MLGQGKSLQQSSEAVGIDVKTGRKYRDMNSLPSEMKKAHTWRTREDVFKDDWKEIKEMLNINPGLEGKTILEWFIARTPEKYQNSHLRRSKIQAALCSAFNHCFAVFKKEVTH